VPDPVPTLPKVTDPDPKPLPDGGGGGGGDLQPPLKGVDLGNGSGDPNGVDSGGLLDSHVGGIDNPKLVEPDKGAPAPAHDSGPDGGPAPEGGHRSDTPPDAGPNQAPPPRPLHLNSENGSTGAGASHGVKDSTGSPKPTGPTDKDEAAEAGGAAVLLGARKPGADPHPSEKDDHVSTSVNETGKDGEPGPEGPDGQLARDAPPVTVPGGPHPEPSHSGPSRAGSGSEQDDAVAGAGVNGARGSGGDGPVDVAKKPDESTVGAGAPDRQGTDPAARPKTTDEEVVPTGDGAVGTAAQGSASHAPDGRVASPEGENGKSDILDIENESDIPGRENLAGPGPHQDAPPPVRTAEDAAGAGAHDGPSTVGPAGKADEPNAVRPGPHDDAPLPSASGFAQRPAEHHQVEETGGTVWSRPPGGGKSMSETVTDGHLITGDGREVHLPAGTKGGFSEGKLWHVTTPDGTVYHRVLDGDWSPPRTETGDMLLIKTVFEVKIKLAGDEGKTVTLEPGSDMVTDLKAPDHNITGDGKNPDDDLSSGDPGRVAGLGDLETVKQLGTKLTAIRGKGEDGQVHTFVFGKDGWTEVDVNEQHYQATLAAAMKETGVAQKFLRLSERQEMLKGLDTEGLKSLLHGPDATADDHFAAIYEIVQREHGKSLCATQILAGNKLNEGFSILMAAGEGKTHAFGLGIAEKALEVNKPVDVSGDGAVGNTGDAGQDNEAVLFVTSRDYLAKEAYDTYKVLENYGYKVVMVSQHEEIKPPVKGEPTIYVSSLDEHAFNILGFKNQPKVHGYHDEEDEQKAIDNESFIKTEGPPDEPASAEVLGKLDWDNKFVTSLDNSDFVREPDGNFHLTPSGMDKLKLALGDDEPPAGRVENVEQGLYAYHGQREDTDYVVDPHDNGRIILINRATGKTSLDDGRGVGSTRYQKGLHQWLEIKHGVMVRADVDDDANELTRPQYFRHETFKSSVGASGTNKGKEGIYAALRPDQPQKPIFEVPRYYHLRMNLRPTKIYPTSEEKIEGMADQLIENVKSKGAGLALVSDNRDAAAIADALISKGYTGKLTVADARWAVERNHEFKTGTGDHVDAELLKVVSHVGEPEQITISSMINRGADPPEIRAVTEAGGLDVITDHSPLGVDPVIQGLNRGGRSGAPSRGGIFATPP